jgi:hypothetical protein
MCRRLGQEQDKQDSYRPHPRVQEVMTEVMLGEMRMLALAECYRRDNLTPGDNAQWPRAQRVQVESLSLKSSALIPLKTTGALLLQESHWEQQTDRDLSAR